MRLLVDTCVISEVVRPTGSPAVKERLASIPDDDLFISVVTIGELARGIALLDAGRKRDRFAASLVRLEHDYGDRILPIDAEAGRIWGELDALRRSAGRVVSVTDGLIAATARRYGLHVATRNVRDFDDTGVLVFNPWEAE